MIGYGSCSDGAAHLSALAKVRSLLQSVQESCGQRRRSLRSVRVTIAEEPGPCPRCGGAMGVQKTVRRCGRTLAHGSFEARESAHVCLAGCRQPAGGRVTRRAVCLSDSLPPRQTVGYDVLVFAGLQRFVHHRQREEVREALRAEHGVAISTGEVSVLQRRFVLCLQRLHAARRDAIGQAFVRDGGWPLHIDATGEDGRGTLLIAYAGWRRWVLGAWKIPTEHADAILPCLRQVADAFGPPVAVVRDLGRAMTPAVLAFVDELGEDIPVLACHQHFLADVGGDLLERPHARLRELFRRFKVRPGLRTLVRDLGRKLGEDVDRGRDAVAAWKDQSEADHAIPDGNDGLAVVRALAQWVLDYADVARAHGLTRARLTQVMNLLLLAPPIQEDVLHLEVLPGREPISERDLRRVLRSPVWEEQAAVWRTVLGPISKKVRRLDFSGKIGG